MGSLLSIPPVVSAVPSSAFVAVSPHVHVPAPTAPLMASSCISVSASVAPSVVGSSVSAVPNRVRAVPDPEVPPPPSFCEVNVAPSTVRCPVYLIYMFAPPTWLHVVVYLSSVAVFVSRSFASTTCTAPVRLLRLVVRGCLRCLPPQFQCLSINLVP